MGSVGPSIKSSLSGFFVYLVSFVQLYKRDKPNKPNNDLLMLAGFFSILLKIPTAFDRLKQRHFVGILDIHPDRNAIGDTRDPGPERFQLVR